MGPIAARDIDTLSDQTMFGPKTTAKFWAFILFKSALSITLNI